MRAESSAPDVGDDVSVGDYVGARLGPAVVERLVEPLLGGVYAGRSRELSLRATMPAIWAIAKDHGSLLAPTGRRPAGRHGAPALHRPRRRRGAAAPSCSRPTSSDAGSRSSRAPSRASSSGPATGWSVISGPTTQASTSSSTPSSSPCPRRGVPASRSGRPRCRRCAGRGRDGLGGRHHACRARRGGRLVRRGPASSCRPWTGAASRRAPSARPSGGGWPRKAATRHT